MAKREDIHKKTQAKIERTKKWDTNKKVRIRASRPTLRPRVSKALKVLEGRWKLIILFYLFRDGTLRLSELERAIPGITQKMLIQQLRSLAGRRGQPPRSSRGPAQGRVQPNPSGQDLCPALDKLLYWAQRWKGQLAGPPAMASVQKD